MISGRPLKSPGVALVDMGVWHWMYDHPDATPAQLRDATLQIAKEIGTSTTRRCSRSGMCPCSPIYSHMIDSYLYLPDYPIGHLIAFQIEQQMVKAEASARSSSAWQSRVVLHRIWMKGATGRPVGPEALLEATEAALERTRTTQDFGFPVPNAQIFLRQKKEDAYVFSDSKSPDFVAGYRAGVRGGARAVGPEGEAAAQPVTAYPQAA